MGITLHQDGDREYYRITKAWNGKEIQKYVRIKKSKAKALREAKALEESLEQRQRAAKERRRLEGLGVLHEDGRVIGLQLLHRTRKGRRPWQEFKIRVKEPGKPVKFKTVSVAAHGIEEAFDLAVERICALRDIPLGSDLHVKMREAKPLYVEEGRLMQQGQSSNVTYMQKQHEAGSDSEDEMALLRGMEVEINEFQRKKAIRG